MAGIKFDFSEVNELVSALEHAPEKVLPKIRAALVASAKLVEADWENDWKGSPHVPGGAASISHEVKGAASVFLGRSAMSAEVGPVLRGQGPIVGMLEYGTPNTGPRGFGAAALHKNEPGFVEAVLDATKDML